ncbi:FAS1 domain-containing protein [Fusarium oxysporum f. sp. albedinis]|nr:FAS1 domain-containing protein [Fusarium oxysporum f. sp. albedinis]
MSLVFCCDAVEPYRPQYLSHQAKFNKFMSWALLPVISTPENGDGASHDLIQLSPPYVVQLVRQVNYGPLESKRYFIPTDGTESDSVEVIENDLIQANFQKVNTYKNYKCQDHNKFFEVNIHQ